jgi:hypothetical protein
MTIMATDEEKRAVQKAKEKALDEIKKELKKLKILNNSLERMNDLINALEQANDVDELVSKLDKAFDDLFNEFEAEHRKYTGKKEALKALIKDTDLSPAGARTVIDNLIEKEKAEAVRHARKGLELLQSAGTMPESVAEATKELSEAAKKLQEIAGKETVKGLL